MSTDHYQVGPKSEQSMAEARRLFPGGVNSPVRSFSAVGGTPPVFVAGKGAILTDLDGRRYLDLVQSWGVHILGHSPAPVVRAIRRQAKLLASVGAPSPGENRLGALIRAAMPSIEKLRFVSSGTEAVMSALRLARGATGRNLIIKFDGCYHGHSDNLLVRAGSGLATAALSASAGVGAAAVAATLSLPYNDLAAVETTFAGNPGQIAAVIVEPLAANMGLVHPAPGFLEGLRNLCTREGSLLVFDEVISGFRVAPGGAQARFGVQPDLTTLGKIIGGGLPVGAYGGRASLMDQVAPLGPVYQAGTLSGNPLAMAAGVAVLERLADGSVHRQIEERSAVFFEQLSPRLDPARFCLNHEANLFTLFFRPGAVRNFAEAKDSDSAAYGRFFHRMLQAGVCLPPAQFEAAFIGQAHSQRQLQKLADLIAANLV